MEQRKVYNSNVVLKGRIESQFEFSHEVYGEEFYKTRIKVKRLSGTEDLVPIMVPKWLIESNLNQQLEDKWVEIKGFFHSYNKHAADGSHLILYVFVHSIEFCEEELNEENCICLRGYLCRPAVYKKTPLGREITELLVAVNRPHGKSDYIPCIVWGRNAKWATNLEVGDNLECLGRIQSRVYYKISEERIAYEVSVNTIQRFS